MRRFRPNLVVATEELGDFPEIEWIGRRIAIGETVLKIEMECPRCVMTTHAQGDLPKDPGVMRALVREAGGCLGVYASVEVPGAVAQGDVAELD